MIGSMTPICAYVGRTPTITSRYHDRDVTRNVYLRHDVAHAPKTRRRMDDRNPAATPRKRRAPIRGVVARRRSGKNGVSVR